MLTWKNHLQKENPPSPHSDADSLDKGGGGYAIVVEPRLVVREYGAKGLKARINLGELASLRREGWKTRDLAKHFGVSLSGVKRTLFRLRQV